MKEIKVMEKAYLEDYDVHVNRYLTYAQIQQIVNAVKGLDGWAERQQNIDMLMLYHVTDISKEKLEEFGHEALLESGLINAVRIAVYNVYEINDALNYTESTQRALAQIIKQLPDMIEPLKKVVEKRGNSVQK